MRGAWPALVLAALLPAACQRRAPSSAVAAHPHYVLGAAYQAGGIWRYPVAHYAGSFTGLAMEQAGAHAPLTANGEVYDVHGMQAASPDLQLPAIARVTNLETGRQVVLRIDDRGPASPAYLLAVTPEVATLLGMRPGEPARVRMTLLAEESHAAADDLPGAPHLPISAAPVVGVTAQSLGLPGSPAPAAPVAIQAAALAPAAPPLNLPAVATQTAPDPGRLYVRLSPFTKPWFAVSQAERLGAGPRQVSSDEAGEYVARLGPFAITADAETALDRAIRAGVTDARIVVE
jgi:rare lipoprotein A